MQCDAHSARTVSHNGHHIRIATKLAYVILDPFEHQHLILERRISRILFGASCHHAQRAQTVVERYQYNVTVHEILGTGKVLALSGNTIETTRMNVDEDGLPIGGGIFMYFGDLYQTFVIVIFRFCTKF